MSDAYRVSAAADDDLVEIGDYIAQFDTDAATRQIESIVDKFPLLAAQPGIGAKRDDLLTGLQCLAVDRYIVFYRTVDQDEISIEVVRVVHGARDLPRVFDDLDVDS